MGWNPSLFKWERTLSNISAGKPLDQYSYMAHRGEVALGIFCGLINALLTRCSRYPMSAVRTTGRSRGSVAVLSQSQRLPLGQSETRGFPSKEERGGGGEPFARELPRAWRKKVEALRDSACAALVAVDEGLFSKKRGGRGEGRGGGSA